MNWFANDKIRFKEISLLELIEAKNKKYLRLPIYQRNAVWSEGRICTLWDSLLRGYPLPSFLVTPGKPGSGLSREFQKTKYDAIGASIEDDSSNEYYDLLDGQQRLSAIDSVFSFGDGSTIRLWVDLAEKKEHPHKNKFWIHVCTKIFPFGFSTQQNGEFDFSVMHDKELDDIWNKVHGHFSKDEFFDYPLSATFPQAAKCPIPLDELLSRTLKLNNCEQHIIKAVIHALVDETTAMIKQLGFEIQTPDENIVDALAKSLHSLMDYRLGFQRIDLGIDDDEYNLFERIGRGGVQITQRQLAVSKIMLSLGKAGTDSIAKFNQSTILQSMLETEDVIHALVRIAYAKLHIHDKDNYEDDNGDIFSKDMIELTPQRLNVLEKDKDKWSKFNELLNSYCAGPGISALQTAFEKMFSCISYKNNSNGFSKAQLAQPDNNADDDGIVPISLHPLLYWFIGNPDATPTDNHSNDMIKWLLFVNGFVKKPKHLKLNRLVFASVVKNNRLDFKEIYSKIYDETNKQLRSDIGLIRNMPVIDHEKNEITLKPVGNDDLVEPQVATEAFVADVILQNTVADRINWFILLWNQRELVSHLYDDISYVPALYSKGRPFDLDHIVARNCFLYKTAIDDKMVAESITSALKLLDPRADAKYFKLTAENFRKWLPYSIANYRYWPRKLNRCDQDKPVNDKMKINWIKSELTGNKLTDKFKNETDDKLWEWCSIPSEHKVAWGKLPPKENNWQNDDISLFFNEVVARHKYLYKKAYDFLKSL